jgi:predicted CDP-diglyceride synthetase/phosphatidate cytidylyltransferase
VRGGSSTQFVSGTITTGTHKIACAYSSGSTIAGYVDGVLLASGTITTYPPVTLDNFSIGSRISSGVYGFFFNDRIRAAALYTTRLTNEQLAFITQP